jgi:uncharacterized protein YciI
MKSRSTFIYITHPVRSGFTEEMLPEEMDAMMAHVAFLKQKVTETTFHLIGPCLDRAFGVAIFEAASLEDAHWLLKDDPAITRGVMTGEIHPFHFAYCPAMDIMSIGRS